MSDTEIDPADPQAMRRYIAKQMKNVATLLENYADGQVQSGILREFLAGHMGALGRFLISDAKDIRKEGPPPRYRAVSPTEPPEAGP